MGFAEEVAAARNKSAPPTMGGDEMMNQGMPEAPAEPGAPEHGDVHPELKAAGVEIPTEPPKTPEEKRLEPLPKSGKIKIGNEVFETEEEALAYAQELQLTLAQKEAFDQGRESTKLKDSTPSRDLFDEVGDEIFEKPKEALKKIYSSAKEDAKTEIRAEMVRQENLRQTWEQFYSQNQDLVDSKDLVDYVMEKNFKEIGNIPLAKAMKILAERTRTMISSRKESTLPSRELPSGTVVSTVPTNTATATVPEKKEAPLDFISQLRNHQRRGS